MIKTVYAVPTLSGGTTTASVSQLHYCMMKGAMCPLATQEGYCKVTACVFKWQDLAKKQEEIGTADYISKTDLLLKLAELPQEASKREILTVIYDMPVVMPPVVWKPIPSTGGVYWAGSDGSIYRPKSGGTRGGFIKPNINKHNGYAYVSISVHNERKTRRAHRLIAEAFLGDANGLQVNHKDGNKTNNAIDNLEYCTQSENMRHAFDTGLEKKHGRKVIDLDTKEVFNTLTDAANAISGSAGEMVNRVCNGTRSHYRNHHYAYYDDYVNGTIPAFKGKNTKKASVGLWR